MKRLSLLMLNDHSKHLHYLLHSVALVAVSLHVLPNTVLRLPPLVFMSFTTPVDYSNHAESTSLTCKKYFCVILQVFCIILQVFCIILQVFCIILQGFCIILSETETVDPLLAESIIIHTYIIGHYNPSVRITT